MIMQFPGENRPKKYFSLSKEKIFYGPLLIVGRLAAAPIE